MAKTVPDAEGWATGPSIGCVGAERSGRAAATLAHGRRIRIIDSKR
jgi:hypothetical protein